MNTKLTIKNFRVFDKNGVSIDIKPLTILTGCNSSGKSSVVKSMLILKHFFMQIKKAFETKAPMNLFDYKIDVATEDLKSLGNFFNTIHRGSDTHEISFEYSIYSLLVSKVINVNLTFTIDPEDELRNGLLSQISMNMDGIEFYLSNRKQHSYSCNLNIIKKVCPEFIELEYLIHRLCSIFGEYNYSPSWSMSREEYEKLMKEGKDNLKSYNERRSKDVLKYVYSSQHSNQDIVQKYGIDPTIFGWTKENDSYFRIPVISELDNAGKDSVRTFVDMLLKDEDEVKEEMVFASKKVISDYLNSDASSFSEYFMKYENAYLEHINVSSVFNSSTGMPRSSDFYVPQEYCQWNPLAWDAISFDDNHKKDDKEEKNEKEKRVKEWKEKTVDFPMIYEVVMSWNKKNGEQDQYYTYDKDLNIFGGYKHHTFSILGSFLASLVIDALNPDAWAGISYSPSARVEANPYYSLSDGSRFASTLKKYFDVRRIYQGMNIKEKSHFKVGSYINKWVKELGIGDRIEFKVIEDFEIVSPLLYKQDDEKGSYLTDVGFGVTQLLSVLIPIETLIMFRLISANEGKGVNRYAGIDELFRLYDNWDSGELKMRSFLHDTIAIEEPEIHLHPNYQSKLAEMFAEAFKNWGVHFVIETHSEYLIRKLQLLVAQKRINNEAISVQYLFDDKDKPDYEPKVKKIIIQNDGMLSDNFGKGFFNEADSLSMNLLTIQRDEE